MTLLRNLAGAYLAAVLSMLAVDSAWSQTIKLVAPYTPGSGPDILSRLLAEQIGQQQGPTVVVENRPGGGTLVGTEAVARAAPDGNTVLFVGNSFVVNPALKKGNYDVTGSFEPVCYLAMTPMVLVVQGSSPYKTLDDLIAAARAKPGSVVFASGGPASSLHVAIEVLKRAAKIDATYVPYGGNAPAINALLGGHVTAVWADYPTVVAHLQSGTLRGLVTTAAKRVATLPAVPTLIETGLSNYEADIFYGIVAPAKTPPPTLAKLAGWFMNAIKAPEMAPKLAKHGVFPVGICGPEFGAYLKRMVDDYSRIIAEANIKAN
ncbi:MAG TPA: tripartite tricarboxylate transporter substrate-binding protein [Xanthobacteraceae bacterium]